MAKSNTSMIDWLQSRPGLLVRLIVAFGLAYALGSKAIDSGRLLDYFLTFVLALLGLKFTVQLIKYGDE